MRIVDKKIVIAHGVDRAPLCGFMLYTHPHDPVLLRRIGWEVSNDIHDDFADAVSLDNGGTWGESRPALRSIPVPGGFICHTENAALYLPERDLLIHWTNDKLEASLDGGCDVNRNSRIRITTGDPDAVSRGTAPDPFISDFGLKQGLVVSFATPFLDSRSRPLLPVQWQKADDPENPLRGRSLPGGVPGADAIPDMSLEANMRFGPLHGRQITAREDMPDVLSDFCEVGLLIGEFQSNGALTWRLSQTVPCEYTKSSRGMNEGTIAELPDSRLCMILRGSNAGWPENPNYKWLTFSEDRGETWAEPVPLACDDGTLIESSSTGSALIRSEVNDKLYWLGNLCMDGKRPYGNMPRSPLFICEIQEDPVAIKRKTITMVDGAQPGEDPDTQHSNFKCYQDRLTGELVVHLTRYGQHGYADNAWIRVDLYQYRIALEE